ncbi:4a-hydroxytetrahydrobiopterin dehydratase [Pseudotabrizicola alkalilacus]|uniref:Putative pterin-4-alpha-carbinolamine dehydratase n=1 Tax=Pseudotabrizicola alkalilacus TaxID=2305252 RepID=A0A411Z5A4_9RHOB|nr:4a-hydroxytetrahydrobiopterin dehydratase [Pseudotabrizicola alkalilacus]RGP38241.1 4a-hydroxytetrahydrobiopterin dehydratase [Pseudotabrizicola alkalilacus]
MTDKTDKSEKSALDRSTLLPLFGTGWKMAESKDALEKTFLFKDFKQAFAFMTKVADDAEALNHHPEWSNVYRTVKVRLTTHDTGGLTKLDVDLARRMDTAAGY